MEDSLARAIWLAEWAMVLDDNQPAPDYKAAIEAVTSADLGAWSQPTLRHNTVTWAGISL